jgi:hypothetical protein
MTRWLFIMSVAAATPAVAAQSVPQTGARSIHRPSAHTAPIHLSKHNRLDPLDGDEFQTVAPRDLDVNEDQAFTATLATSVAVAQRGRPRPAFLSVTPLAGHNAFDTIQRQRTVPGWRLATTNSVLGVGLTGRFGVAISGRLTAMPFVLLDYARIDSARRVDTHSPNPYMRANANIGLIATVGAGAAWRFGPSRRFRFSGFAALVAAAGAEGPTREAASIGARIVQSVGDTTIQPIYAEAGASVSYAPTPLSRVSAGIVQTVNRQSGDQLAFRIAMRTYY